MAEVNFKETLNGLMSSMEGMCSTKSVVGNPINLPDGTVILPLVDVSFGVGAGAFNKDSKNKAGAAMGAKMSPSAVLVVRDGNTRLITLKDQDTLSRLMEMLPDVIERLQKLVERYKGNKPENDLSDEDIDQIAEELLNQDQK